MRRLSTAARIAAGLVALVGIAALVLQFTVPLEKEAGLAPAALWSMLRFFTIIGNTLTALVMLGAALGLRRTSTPAMLGGVTLFMGLIGVVYATVLRQTQHLTGDAQIANILLHYTVPPLVALFWLMFAPKGGLTRMDPLRWALLPLVYFPYAVARGRLDGRYPYPFMDVAKLGWVDVLTNAAVIASGFLLAGLLLVLIDQLMRRDI